MPQKNVTVTVDRPIGSAHPKYSDMIYPVNYGFVEGVLANDGEWQDAYVLGIDEPIERFYGSIIAVIHRKNDNEDKWVVAPSGVCLNREDILKAVHFQEKYFDIELIM